MEEEGGPRLSKRFSDKGGEVDLKTKAGTAWSHNFLNQKPWHPLSYPNQRRKWIAEQTYAEKQRRAEEVAREYAQEQDFFRQTALVSKKEKEKMEMMKAVSFMYIRPPGYNAESAKAAEIADEHNDDQGESDPTVGASSSRQLDSLPATDGKTKSRPKDVFGRHLPTGEQFEVLKNAPKLETGVQGRAKPFGIEIRNVKCVRCGNFGHQSGDRECPLKDVIMPNEESRLKRDDPLTAILAQTDAAEPLKWELKQKPGLSPPRGGFDFDDPNQQIVAEDIFDEYGGFLSGDMPELLANFSSGNPKKKKTSKRKKKKQSLPSSSESRDGEDSASLSDDDWKKSSKKRKHKRQLSSSISDESYEEKSMMSSERDKRSKKRHKKKSRPHHPDPSTSEDDHDRHRKISSKHLDSNGRHRSRHHHTQSSDDHQSRSSHHQSSGNDFDLHQKSRSSHHQSSDNDSDQHQKSRSSHHRSSDNDYDRHHKSRRRCRRTEADSSDHSDHSGHRSMHRRHRHRQRAACSRSPDHSDVRVHHHHHH